MISVSLRVIYGCTVITPHSLRLCILRIKERIPYQTQQYYYITAKYSGSEMIGHFLRSSHSSAVEDS